MENTILKLFIGSVAAASIWSPAAQAAYSVTRDGSRVSVNVDAGDSQTITEPFDADVTEFLKTGGGTLTIDCVNAALTGDADIEEGRVVIKKFQALGGDAGIQWEAASRQAALYRAKGAIRVHDGACLEIDAGKVSQANSALVKRIRLNGTGPDGEGALRVKSAEWANQDFFFAFVELAADARVVCLDNARYGFRHLDPDGHELSVKSPYQLIFRDSRYLSGGGIRYLGNCQVLFSGSQTFAEEASGRFAFEGETFSVDMSGAQLQDFKWGICLAPNAAVSLKYSGAWDSSGKNRLLGPMELGGPLTLVGTAPSSSIRFEGPCACTSASGAVIAQTGTAEFAEPLPASALRIGNTAATTALVVAESGAMASNRLTIGTHGRGALHLLGGSSVASAIGGELDKYIGQNAASCGYLGVFGGSLEYDRNLVLSSDPTSVGICDLVNGQMKGTTLKISCGGWGELYLDNGELALYSMNATTIPHVLGANGTAGGGGQAVLTLTGASPEMRMPWGDRILLCERTESFTAVVNLNAGVLDTASITRGASDAEDDARARAYLNFNGGTYKQRYNNNAAIFGTEATALDRVTVYAGGAVFDTPYTAVQSADTPLCAPTGRGIASIALPDAIRDERYIGAPEVRICGGGGTGATAHALYDPTTRCVTNIAVTCPGWDYATPPTATICSADRSVTNVCVVTLTEEPLASGGIVKKGSSALTLNAINTYTGDTVLVGGLLTFAAKGSLPEDSTVVFAGGEISYPSSNGIHRKFAIDCETALAKAGGLETWQYVPSASTFELRRIDSIPEDLDAATLFTFRGTLDGVPTITGYDSEKFRVYIANKAIKIKRKRGLLCIIR